MEHKLSRKYGLFTAIAMVVGIVIGSGVFFKAQTILEKTGGDVKLGILAWLLGGRHYDGVHFGFRHYGCEVCAYQRHRRLCGGDGRHGLRLFCRMVFVGDLLSHAGQRAGMAVGALHACVRQYAAPGVCRFPGYGARSVWRSRSFFWS